MSKKTAPPAVQVGDFILYQTEDGGTRIQCRFENETIWLSQVQLAELFHTSVPNINLHLKAIYAEGELSETATIKSYLIVRAEGARQVSREVLHYSLPAILAVGLRVNSTRATQFRQWATARPSHFRHTGAGRYPAIEQARAADKTVVQPCGNYPINWIPACAGMTAEVYA